MSILYKKHSDFPDAILIRDFKNSVDVNEIINSWENLKENDLLTDKLKGVINNLLDCDLNMNMDSFKMLMGYLKQNECFYKIKLAVICNKPKIVVYPTLGEEKEGALKIKPFSTIDAAVEWIIE
ncbi:hypothetical protein [Carboxylicivirga linearis]|uniref:STAS/SEC14 domain-containing protein n=1 Tax=Carboxylicivirga linearis TaxID=1628157 RepID=A0ABS5JRW6_9BACT|nr:hypothetical protein [Carboxylicivirga linearis]MBS2097609.1 hypothetical protein [Carboxylicivirga linearis]